MNVVKYRTINYDGLGSFVFFQISIIPSFLLRFKDSPILRVLHSQLLPAVQPATD